MLPTSENPSGLLTAIRIQHSISSDNGSKAPINESSLNLFNQAWLNRLDDNPTVIRLLNNVPPIDEHTLCLLVLELFQKQPSLFAVPVVNHLNHPVGIVERNSFVETFIRPYAKELNAKKTIADFMNKTPVIVDKETSIDDIARIIVDAGMQHMVSGFIATDEGQYLGIANGHNLLTEITQRKQANLFKLAHFDQLTKLPNRVLFLDRLNMAIIQSERQQSQVGLLFIDLDKFKHFNDSMGHSFGDELLIAVSERLIECARESETVARLSGDEFTILLDNVKSQADLDVLCNRILDSMKQPLRVMGREVFITVSIGSAMCPSDDDKSAGLLVKADAAMYEAKRSGRNAYRHYVTGMNLYSYERMTLETDLRMALERNEFELYYQPQVLLSSGKVVGNEALIRWRHPLRGLLPPIHFIELIEESGLIVPIGKWVIEEACRQQVIWMRSGLEPMCMSVNISAMQFYQSDFCEMVKSIVIESGIQPEHLELELTESVCMHDVGSVLIPLQELHDFGVKLAIDDFGTGFSNLSYLNKFPIDRLKIDQSFIRHIESEPVNIEIVRAIVALGRSMSLELVAEGVETDNEMDLAESCGCEFVQGYRFSKPLPADQLELWLSDFSKKNS
ncbi:EAL domain-containing protein [Methylotenera sp.]|uniref:EAL domain-containing protein n=1 Tax=Methylotenera sp. TaxID=2051956 RepID=UPI00248A5B34|nr:EAL domain-containing protein [Methylotenera sp.]MDI1362682.1 EAL domain-containing protein [Methylotenera sp.]